jgi:quinol monooxygenase YgiN
MAKQTVCLAVDFTINEGKRDAFEAIAQEMVAGSQKESGTLGYEWFWSADGKRSRLIETYTDAAAVLAHFSGPAVSSWCPRF